MDDFSNNVFEGPVRSYTVPRGKLVHLVNSDGHVQALFGINSCVETPQKATQYGDSDSEESGAELEQGEGMALAMQHAEEGGESFGSEGAESGEESHGILAVGEEAIMLVGAGEEAVAFTEEGAHHGHHTEEHSEESGLEHHGEEAAVAFVHARLTSEEGAHHSEEGEHHHHSEENALEVGEEAAMFVMQNGEEHVAYSEEGHHTVAHGEESETAHLA